MPFDPELARAIREAATRGTDGSPLPIGHRRTLSPTEVARLRESLRSGGAGFGEVARPPSPAPAATPPVAGSVAEQRPEWLTAGYVEKVVAEVAARAAGLVKLETDRGKLAEMSNEAFAEHVAAVAEAAEMAGAPLPPACIADGKALAEMSDQEFRSYSERLLSAPARLEARPRKRQVNETVDVDNLASLSESARVAASGGPTTRTEVGEEAGSEAILEAHRSALRATGRARSPFWR